MFMIHPPRLLFFNIEFNPPPKKNDKLVGGFNPSEKYFFKMGSSSPNRGENKKNETTT